MKFQDNFDDLIRLAKELKVNGLYELLLDKKLTNGNLNQRMPENIENNENVIKLTKENHPNKINEASNSHKITLTNFNIAPEINKLTQLLQLPADTLKSSPKFENWMRRLSSK